MKDSSEFLIILKRKGIKKVPRFCRRSGQPYASRLSVFLTVVGLVWSSSEIFVVRWAL